MLILLTLLAVSVTIRLLTAADHERLEERSRTGTALGTFATCIVIAPEGEADRILDSMDSLARHLDRELGCFEPEGEVSRLNASGWALRSGMSDHLRKVIDMSMEIAALTDSLFDPTLGAIVTLWDFTGSPHIPSGTALDSALMSSGLAHFSIHGDTMVLAAGMCLDLGAVAKGYASDAVYELAIARGARAALVEIGGEVRCGGDPEVGREWRVAVRNPRADGVLDVREMCGGAVATSGDYESCFFDSSGARLCHILDPRTGMPEQGVASATVIARECGPADALATAICVGGVTLAESLPDSVFIELIVVTIDAQGGGTSVWRRRSEEG
jgi:thiamine biosynthesis lipoprotein